MTVCRLLCGPFRSFGLVVVRLRARLSLENSVTGEDGEWDPARVVVALNSYGWETDDKRARALLRALTEQDVLEKIPNRGGRADYQVVNTQDGLYYLDPERATIENGPSTPARVARLACEDSGPTE